MSLKKSLVICVAGWLLGCGIGAVALINPAPANAEAPQAIIDAVQTAKDTVEELDGLAIVCLTVALTPLGAMLTLRFLNMVLSRV